LGETFDKAIKLGYNPNIVNIGDVFSQEVSIDYFGQVILDDIKKFG
jgi:hypothetical protein